MHEQLRQVRGLINVTHCLPLEQLLPIDDHVSMFEAGTTTGSGQLQFKVAQCLVNLFLNGSMSTCSFQIFQRGLSHLEFDSLLLHAHSNMSNLLCCGSFPVLKQPGFFDYASSTFPWCLHDNATRRHEAVA
ncbi:hypothetical protein VFPPC_18739 [Pochonia chlamydosporia 170]|uniref:Uncharacterized protein n=1 Tax=Pochonia chlamydosporia 170 TaxID=1380566 RepID=A0A219ATC0_METCM|nr:hypothetical protein VFPPC_18739 [Pochonia chlamydosporia 170]OWT43534.1 hypothetical protein VFPPC_18739 [Pochonia chlamydosporia 170]